MPEVLAVEIAGKGGICHYTYNLVRNLNGFRPARLITGKDYELREMADFPVYGLFNRLRTRPDFAVRFLSILKKSNARIVHFQLSQYPGFVLLLFVLSGIAGKKRVVTAHNVVSHEQRGWERGIFDYLYRKADAVIVHAEANKQELVNGFNVPEGKVRVIPHGNYMFFQKTPEPCPLPETPSVLFFGYIRKYKGLMHLIKAFSEVRKEMPEARLRIVGKPVEDFSVYQELILGLGLEKAVETELEYVPFDKVKDYFNQSSLLVLPYDKIYQSGVLQLAYGFGRPVIVTDTGGLPEAVEEGKNGLIVPVADVPALARAMLQILKDRRLQEEMGRRSFALALTRYSWKNIAEQTESLYQELERA